MTCINIPIVDSWNPNAVSPPRYGAFQPLAIGIASVDYALIMFTALVVSGVTLFSGFGLGTVLMPTFAVFFPVTTAIAATAVVHLANNLFKLGLVGKQANWRVVAIFSLPQAHLT